MTYREVLKKYAAVIGKPLGWNTLPGNPQDNIRFQLFGEGVNKLPTMRLDNKKMKAWKQDHAQLSYENKAGDQYLAQSPEYKWEQLKQDPIGLKEAQEKASV